MLRTVIPEPHSNRWRVASRMSGKSGPTGPGGGSGGSAVLTAQRRFAKSVDNRSAELSSLLITVSQVVSGSKAEHTLSSLTRQYNDILRIHQDELRDFENTHPKSTWAAIVRQAIQAFETVSESAAERFERLLHTLDEPPASHRAGAESNQRKHAAEAEKLKPKPKPTPTSRRDQTSAAETGSFADSDNEIDEDDDDDDDDDDNDRVPMDMDSSSESSDDEAGGVTAELNNLSLAEDNFFDSENPLENDLNNWGDAQRYEDFNLVDAEEERPERKGKDVSQVLVVDSGQQGQ